MYNIGDSRLLSRLPDCQFIELTPQIKPSRVSSSLREGETSSSHHLRKPLGLGSRFFFHPNTKLPVLPPLNVKTEANESSNYRSDSLSLLLLTFTVYINNHNAACFLFGGPSGFSHV